MKRFFSAGTICFAVYLGGCDSSNVDALSTRLLVASNDISAVVVTSPSQVIQVDKSRPLTLTGTIGDAEAVLTSSAQWSSSAPEFVSVNSAGVVTGVANGSATITGRLGSLTSSIELRASTAVLQVINITTDATATDATIDECTNVSFTATGDYSDGEIGRPITDLVEWRVTGGSIGFFNDNDGGLLRSSNAGVGTITATLDDVEGSMSLTVSDNLSAITLADDGTTLSTSNAVQYTATATYLEVTDTVDITNNADWSIDATFATVSTSLPDKGIVTATSTGNELLVASCGGQTGSLSISSGSSTEILELRFNINSPSDRPFVGAETLQLSASVVFANGGDQDVTQQADWVEISSTTSQISVSNRDGSKGEVTIRGAGELVIEVRYQDDNGDVSVPFTSRFRVVRQ